MERSFADAANNHGFKRSRWRGLWRQRIQDYLIAAVQNIRIWLRHGLVRTKGAVPAPAEVRVTVWRLFLVLALSLYGRHRTPGGSGRSR